MKILKRVDAIVPDAEKFRFLVAQRMETDRNVKDILEAEAARYFPAPKPRDAFLFAMAKYLLIRDRDLEQGRKDETHVKRLATLIGLADNALFRSTIAESVGGAHKSAMAAIARRRADVATRTARGAF
jgi:hypothetical protein